MITDVSIISAFQKDVLSKYPNEACGLVAGNAYWRCTNTSPTPTEAFKIDATERMTIELQHGPIQAVLHSHPYDIAKSRPYLQQKYNPVWPSVPDQAGFIADNVPWGIVATDGQGFSALNWLSNDPQPMERRQFAWFTSDCYSVVRDWLNVHSGIILPNFTREWNFWEKGEDTIGKGIESITSPSYTQHPAKEAQIGDVAVFAVVGAKVVNHLGVISKNNTLFHIFPGDGYYAQEDKWKNKWDHRARYVLRFTKP